MGTHIKQSMFIFRVSFKNIYCIAEYEENKKKINYLSEVPVNNAPMPR